MGCSGCVPPRSKLEIFSLFFFCLVFPWELLPLLIDSLPLEESGMGLGKKTRATTTTKKQIKIKSSEVKDSRMKNGVFYQCIQ